LSESRAISIAGENRMQLYALAHAAWVTRRSISRLASDNRASIDLLGLDYYVHSEMEWAWDSEPQCANISWPVRQPVGFAKIAKEYVDHFRVPVLLAETNLCGSYLDRLTWLKFMEDQCETLAAEADFRGFCGIPLFDSTDWCHLCMKATAPWTRRASGASMAIAGRGTPAKLSDYYIRLAKGTANAADLPRTCLARARDNAGRLAKT